MLTWRCRCEWSGSQRPDFGLRCSCWVSSRPLEPLCHGNIAPAKPAARAAARAAPRRACRYSSNAAGQRTDRWKLRNGKMNSSSQKMWPR